MLDRCVDYPQGGTLPFVQLKEQPMRLCKLMKSQSGQGMTEYLIIVALIAIAAIGVVTVFGADIRQLFATSTTSLTGVSATSNAKAAKVKNKNLSNFGQYNAATGD